MRGHDPRLSIYAPSAQFRSAPSTDSAERTLNKLARTFGCHISSIVMRGHQAGSSYLDWTHSSSAGNSSRVVAAQYASALCKTEPHIGQWPLLPVHPPCHHGGLQSCTRAARSFLAARRSWPSRARRSGGSAGSRGSARTRSVHRAWSVSAAEPVLRPTWRHRTAKLARRGRAQGPAGSSDERARRDRREPLAPLARQGLPARKVTRVPRRPIASSPERTPLAARRASFWLALYA